MADDQKTGEPSRRAFLKIGGGLLIGGVVAAVATDALIGNKTTTTTETSTLNPTLTSTVAGPTSTVTSPGTTSTITASSISTVTSTTTVTAPPSTTAAPTTNQQAVFLNLSTSQATELAAMVSVIIPTDSNGPGGTSAGAIYFIDRQLASDYGKNGNMYNVGPFVAPGQTSPITVNDLTGKPITYSGGTMITLPSAGTQYFYGMSLSDFWRYGLDAFETYCNSAYGGNFESLSAANQVSALTDLTTNKPTSFNNIIPSDFFNEVFRMTWDGFLMDPLYGGNQGMVGWELVGFNGVNTGNFYGEGYTSMQLMVASTPTQLKPASLAQYQQAALG